jgi:hypothetical protein
VNTTGFKYTVLNLKMSGISYLSKGTVLWFA